jgi:hypothetical protein
MMIELYEDAMVNGRQYIAGDVIEVSEDEASRLMAAGLARPAPVTLVVDSVLQEGMCVS